MCGTTKRRERVDRVNEGEREREMAKKKGRKDDDDNDVFGSLDERLECIVYAV